MCDPDRLAEVIQLHRDEYGDVWTDGPPPAAQRVMSDAVIAADRRAHADDDPNGLARVGRPRRTGRSGVAGARRRIDGHPR